jgi:hypothetical protein
VMRGPRRSADSRRVGVLSAEAVAEVPDPINRPEAELSRTGPDPSRSC